jgi:uncharacterized membrane protein
VNVALRRRLDALVALLGLAVALLAALVATRSLAALVGAILGWTVCVLAVWVGRPSYRAGETGSD